MQQLSLEQVANMAGARWLLARAAAVPCPPESMPRCQRVSTAAAPRHVSRHISLLCCFLLILGCLSSMHVATPIHDVRGRERWPHSRKNGVVAGRKEEGCQRHLPAAQEGELHGAPEARRRSVLGVLTRRCERHEQSRVPARSPLPAALFSLFLVPCRPPMRARSWRLPP